MLFSFTTTILSAKEFGIVVIKVKVKGVTRVLAQGKCPMCEFEFEKVFTLASSGSSGTYTCPCDYFTYRPVNGQVEARLSPDPEMHKSILADRLPGIEAQKAGRHFCKGEFSHQGGILGWAGSILECFEDPSGRFWLWCGGGVRENCSGTNFCPYCGTNAPIPAKFHRWVRQEEIEISSKRTSDIRSGQTKHFCKGEFVGYPDSCFPSMGISECFEDEVRRLWVWCGHGQEYCSGTNYCPYCGTSAHVFAEFHRHAYWEGITISSNLR